MADYKSEIQRYHKYYQQIEPKLNKRSSKAYTTIVFSFLVVSLFGWYAIRPTIQTIIYLQREIKDKTELSKKMEDKITALIEAQAYYQEIEPLLPVIDQALPAKPDAIPLVIQLRNLASASGAQVTAIQLPAIPIMGQDTVPGSKSTPIAAPGTSKQLSYDLSVAVRGPYPNVRAYLEGLIQMRRIVSVESVTLVPVRADLAGAPSASPSASSRLLQLALIVKTYYLVQ